MTSYGVYGECLRSELHFPELPEIQAAGMGARWRFRLGRSASSLDDAVLLGTEQLLETVTARLERGRDRFRLSLEDTGIFDIALDGQEIVWIPPTNADAVTELARADVLGRALPIAMHAVGELCLHASAVAGVRAVSDESADAGGSSGSEGGDGDLRGTEQCGAIGFLADAGFGKSTLALALVGRGARLLTDDGLRIVPGTPALAVSAFPTARLRPDAARRLGRYWGAGVAGSAKEGGDGGWGGDAKQLMADGKLVLRSLGSHEWIADRAPLSALYLLAPVAPGRGRPPVQRRRLSISEGALAIVRYAKVASLLGGVAGGVQLRLACALAECTPVYRLEVVRDLEQLEDVAHRLLGWHLPRARG